nr:PEP-CTERM sorting domain-containing protein [Halochromatium glycolicum]
MATTSIPEPGTLALLGAGLLGIGAYYRRHRV